MKTFDVEEEMIESEVQAKVVVQELALSATQILLDLVRRTTSTTSSTHTNSNNNHSLVVD